MQVFGYVSKAFLENNTKAGASLIPSKWVKDKFEFHHEPLLLFTKIENQLIDKKVVDSLLSSMAPNKTLEEVESEYQYVELNIRDDTKEISFDYYLFVLNDYFIDDGTNSTSTPTQEEKEESWNKVITVPITDHRLAVLNLSGVDGRILVK